MSLYCYYTSDVWVWVVVFEREVFELEIEYALNLGIDDHARKRTRIARHLQLDLLEVVAIDVGIAKCVDELTSLESGDLCHHHEQKRIRCDVERNAKEDIGAALV